MRARRAAHIYPPYGHWLPGRSGHKYVQMFTALDLTLAHQPDAVTRLRQRIRECHADLERGAATWLNTPRSLTVWSSPVRLYVHALCVEDITIQAVLREVAPLFTWLWPDLGGPPDGAALRQYCQAVYASTDVYLVNLSSGGLGKVVDLSRLGFGQRTVAWVIDQFVTSELARIAAVISGLALASNPPSLYPTRRGTGQRNSGRTAPRRVNDARLPHSR